MNTQNPFKQLLPEHLSDKAAYSLWECFHELAMACEKKYAHQINREYAQQCMLDAAEHDHVLPGKGDRQIEMPF